MVARDHEEVMTSQLDVLDTSDEVLMIEDLVQHLYCFVEGRTQEEAQALVVAYL